MTDSSMPNLSTGAQRLIETALQKRDNAKHTQLCIKHWLSALLERHPAMVEMLVIGIRADDAKEKIDAEILQNEPGEPLEMHVVMKNAYDHARSRNKLQAMERDLAIIILTAGGYTVTGVSPTYTTQKQQDVQSEKIPETPPHKVPSATPALDQFGRNLTEAARNGKLSQILGRDEETLLMIETLCRRSKRNPVLIGPAGVGKTAVVEGLANLIVAGKVPYVLLGMDIISLQPSTLVAGADTRGELEKRIQAILKEASANNILLFIDEIHTIMGAGGMTGTTDIGAQLKPALARGEIAIIAATTDDEYRKFIETDTALERRFQPIRINELSEEQTLHVLVSLSKELTNRFNVTIDEGVFAWLIQFGSQYMRNRHFPDKAVDLLEQSIAHAVALDQTNVTITDARDVAQRMVGMPLSLDKRLDNLREAIKHQSVLSSEELQLLTSRLQVTMRGLDIRSNRPNTLLLLSNQAADSSEVLASVLASALFGDARRVVTIDLSRMVQPEDVTLLVGAPPGYVGYSDSLPLHRLVQTPWCVVRFENIDQCHPQIRAVIAQAMTEGKITDGRGRPIYFSDTIVLLTASIPLTPRRSLGFSTNEAGFKSGDIYRSVSATIGAELADQVDLFLPGVRPMEISKDWLEGHLLQDLEKRFFKQGIQLNWEASLVDWLFDKRGEFFNERDWERWIDDTLSPQIIPYLSSLKDNELLTLRLGMSQDQVKIEIPAGGNSNGI